MKGGEGDEGCEQLLEEQIPVGWHNRSHLLPSCTLSPQCGPGEGRKGAGRPWLSQQPSGKGKAGI